MKIKLASLGILLSAFALNSGATPTQIDMLGNVSVKDDPNTTADVEGNLSVNNGATVNGRLYLQGKSGEFSDQQSNLLVLTYDSFTPNTVTGFNSILIGGGNSGNINESIVSGVENALYGTYRSIVFGNQNSFTSSTLNYSFIMGANNIGSSGVIGASFVLGSNNNVGNDSFAFGSGNTVNRWSFAFGFAHLADIVSASFGSSVATYNGSFGAGSDNNAFNYSTVFGTCNNADWGSFAVGYSLNVSEFSFAYGEGCQAYNFSFAGGLSTVSTHVGQVTFGAWNDYSITGTGEQIQFTDWMLHTFYYRMDDPLFVLGNGTSEENRSNAFVVLRNGNTQINGALNVQETVRAKRGGDIFMGEYGRAEDSGSAN